MDTSLLAELVGSVIAAMVVSVTLLAGLTISRKNKHDSLRFKLFSVRDRLAMMAAKGKIDPDGKPYMTLRGFINGTLKHTHEIGVSEYAWFVNNDDSRSHAEFVEAIDALSPTARAEWLSLAVEAFSISIEIIKFNSRFVRMLRLFDILRKERVDHQPPVVAVKNLERTLDGLKGTPVAA